MAIHSAPEQAQDATDSNWEVEHGCSFDEQHKRNHTNS